jgi:hypothetical protein
MKTKDGRFQYQVIADWRDPNQPIDEKKPHKKCIRITGYEGSDLYVRVPARINDLPVRVLGHHTFYESGITIQGIDLPDTLRVIEAEAMEFCVCLSELRMREGLVEIGRNFLNATQVSEIDIPSTAEVMDRPGEWECSIQIAEDNPFYQDDGYGIYSVDQATGEKELVAVHHEKDQKKYTLAKGTKGIADHAFYQARDLEVLEIWSDTSEIQDGAFTILSDPELENSFSWSKNVGRRLQVELAPQSVEIEDDKSAAEWRLDKTSAAEGKLDKTSAADKMIEVGPGDVISLLGCILIREPGRGKNKRNWRILYGGRDFQGDISSINKALSQTGDGSLVDSIAREAFQGSSIETVSLPLSIQYVGKHAFRGCHLKRAYLEEVDDKETQIDFPYEHGYLMSQLMEGFGRNGYRYDFTEYDTSILEGTWIQEKLRMAVSRLRSRKHLSQEQEELIRSRIQKDLLPIVSLLEEIHDGETLGDLVGLHFFNEDNIDQAIALLNGSQSRELLPILLNEKQKLKPRPFDFSL